MGPTNETLELEVQLKESPTKGTTLERSLNGRTPEVQMEGLAEESLPWEVLLKRRLCSSPPQKKEGSYLRGETQLPLSIATKILKCYLKEDIKEQRKIQRN